MENPASQTNNPCPKDRNRDSLRAALTEHGYHQITNTWTTHLTFPLTGNYEEWWGNDRKDVIHIQFAPYEGYPKTIEKALAS